MSRNGTYSIKVHRRIIKENAELLAQKGSNDLYTKIVSNTVKVTVVDVPYTAIKQHEGLYFPSQSEKTSDVTKVASSPTWQEGDTWPLKVELLTTELQSATPQDKTAPQEPRLIAAYDMKVKVAGTEQVEGGDYWQLDFVPSREAPASVSGQSYRVLVSKKDGSTVAVVGLRGFGNPDLKKAPDLTFVRDAPLGYPLHIFPLDVERKLDLSDGSHLELSTQTTGAQRTLQAAFQPPVATTFKGFTVRQTWSPGQKWWDKYEMIDEQRHLILRAIRADSKP